MFGLFKRENIESERLEEKRRQKDLNALNRFTRKYEDYFDERVSSKKLYAISVSGNGRDIFVEEIPPYGGLEQVVPYVERIYGASEQALYLGRRYGYIFKPYSYFIKSEPMLLNTTQIQTIESKEVNVAEEYIRELPDSEWRYEE